MIIVCFINNLVDKHIIDVLNESRTLSKVNMSRSNNTSQAESFHSEKRDFSFPLIDMEDKNEELQFLELFEDSYSLYKSKSFVEPTLNDRETVYFDEWTL